MKIVAKFLGKVNEFNKPPALSYVTLKNVDDGEEVDTDAVSQMLLDAGIDREGVEFEVLVTEENGKHIAVTKKLEPRQLSEADLKAISDQVDAKLNANPPTDFTI
jgi:ribosomal protein L12E/L44/L45/RPP1/RPP2